jgi:hypothetical protein
MSDQTRPFNRQEHCRRIGQAGGYATLEKYGVAHFRAIATAGRKTTVERHGEAYWRGLVQRKGWAGARHPDLAAGEEFTMPDQQLTDQHPLMR